MTIEDPGSPPVAAPTPYFTPEEPPQNCDAKLWRLICLRVHALNDALVDALQECARLRADASRVAAPTPETPSHPVGRINGAQTMSFTPVPDHPTPETPSPDVRTVSDGQLQQWAIPVNTGCHPIHAVAEQELRRRGFVFDPQEARWSQGAARTPETPSPTFESDPRVTPFIGYCPYCPLHEGRATHQRLTDVTRDVRQCPQCHRVFIVCDPPLAGAVSHPQPDPKTTKDDEVARGDRRGSPAGFGTAGKGEGL